MTLLDIAGHLPGAKLHGDEMRAYCPVCKSSLIDALSIKMSNDYSYPADGKIIVDCQEGKCGSFQIMRYLNLHGIIVVVNSDNRNARGRRKPSRRD